MLQVVQVTIAGVIYLAMAALLIGIYLLLTSPLWLVLGLLIGSMTAGFWAWVVLSVLVGLLAVA